MHHEVVRRTRWFSSAALLGAACLLMASTSPQCSRTNDMLLGPSSKGVGRNDQFTTCRSSCLDVAAQARVDERTRFLAAIQSCDDSDCRDAEAQLHASIMQQISADLQICFGTCHNQGGGEGGN